MFFGWYVVAGTFLSQLFVVGFFTYAVSLLSAPVREEFGVSMEQVMYSLTLGTLVGVVAMPVAGILIDRYSSRWVMALGLVAVAAGLLALASATTITQYILFFGLTMAIAHSFAGTLASSATISRWFSSSRGKALGIAAIGTSVGGILIPALMTHWLELVGWRTSVEWFAYGVLILVLPFIILTVRGKPADVGLLPEGGKSSDVHTTAPGLDLSPKAIITNPAYWYLALALGALSCVYSAVLANLAPYAMDLGLSSERASSLIMAVAIMGLIGKVLFGMAADRVNLKYGLWSANLLACAGLLIFAMEPAYIFVLLGSCFMGLAAGGMLPVWGAMIAKIFGLVSYGRVMGFMGPVITLSVMPGFGIMGKLYDVSGSYQSGL